MASLERGTRQPSLNHYERPAQVCHSHPLKSLDNYPFMPSFLPKN